MSGACPACGAPLAAWRTVVAGEPGAPPVALLRCPACGTAVTAAPAPTVADGYDAGAYGTARPRLAGLLSPVLARFDRARLALVRRAVRPPARLLDAGAGRGRFVAAARRAGYDATGVEPSERGVAAARDEYGVALERATIADAGVAPGSVDVVVLWHVLEHLDDPAGALARIAGWLRPGGAVLLGVPNVASIQARLAGPRWWHFDAPRHRTHFTARGLRTLLEREGFAVEHEHHVLLEHNPVGLWMSLLPTRTPTFLYHLLKRNTPPRAGDLFVTLAALPLLPVAGAAELVFGLARGGGTIAVIARATGARSPAAR